MATASTPSPLCAHARSSLPACFSGRAWQPHTATLPRADPLCSQGRQLSRRARRRRSHTLRTAALLQPDLLASAAPHVHEAAVTAAAAVSGALPHGVGDWMGQHVVSHLSLAYEPIVLPCSRFNCGDVVHKSTLDPVLRLEREHGITWQGIALVTGLFAYLFARPGVLVGAWDYYVLARYQRLAAMEAITKEDLKLGKKLATGGFGTVYKAEIVDGAEDGRPVVVKKAKEFGEAEVWMNERLMRTAPQYFAKFLTAFDDAKSEGPASAPPSVWLVWNYEGDCTLADLMGKKDFPYNLEAPLLGRELALEKGTARKLATIRLAMRQVLEALQACHNTGIVHRDVKPQNAIVCGNERRLKLIDLGAAADLRVGINYIPNEFLLDPRYAPPQQYIMSTQTPHAPPTPVAAMLSPILWALNAPDRFDMYSAGVLLLQMVVPALRNDNNLIAFNRKLESFGYDLAVWRRWQEKRGGRDWAEVFELVDADNGALWDLLTSLMQYQPRKRLSAAAALRHPFFGSGLLGSMGSALARVGETVDSMVSRDDWLGEAMSKSGSQKVGGLTEAQINDELSGSMQVPMALRRASATVVWWQKRRVALQNRVASRSKQLGKAVEDKLGTDLEGLKRGAGRSVREGRKRGFSFLGLGARTRS